MNAAVTSLSDLFFARDELDDLCTQAKRQRVQALLLLARPVTGRAQIEPARELQPSWLEGVAPRREQQHLE